MNIDAVTENDVEIVRVEGKVDFATAGALDAKLTEVVDGGAFKLLLNFKNVPFIASAGLTSVFPGRRRALRVGLTKKSTQRLSLHYHFRRIRIVSAG